MRRPGVIATVVALFVAVLPGAIRTDNYPSWQDVQNAKANAASAQAELGVVQAALQRLVAASAAAQQTALDRAIDLQRAKDRLADATTAATAARATADADAAAAQRTQRTAAVFALELQRAAGPLGAGVSVVSSTRTASVLLDRLTSAARLARTAADLRDRASYAARTADAARRQADVAQQTRAGLEADAATASRIASAAAASAAAQAASAQQNQTVLEQQTAYLQGQAVEVSRQYQIGVQVRAQIAQSASYGTGSARIDNSGVVDDPAGAKAYAQSQLGAYGWTTGQWGCLVSLWTRESGWRTSALNASSGAYGIPQALPGNKMSVAGAQWITDFHPQIDWGLGYISSRYGTPCGAWAHETSIGWY